MHTILNKFAKENRINTVITIIIWVLLWYLTFYVYEDLGNKKDNNTISMNQYKVTDNFVNEDEIDFFSKPNRVELLEQLYNWECNNDNWNYIVINSQPIEITDANIPSMFEYGYEYQEDTPNVYKGIQINENFFKTYDIVDGRQKFNNNDYILSDDIEVILGNNYKEIYKTGEMITCFYLGEEFSCKVIGFLKKNAAYNNGYEMVNLDNYIVLPSFSDIGNACSIVDVEKFKLKLYLDKCAGYILTKETSDVVQETIDDECKIIGIKPYSIEGYIDSPAFSSNQTEIMFIMISLILLLLYKIVISGRNVNVTSSYPSDVYTMQEMIYGTLIENGSIFIMAGFIAYVVSYSSRRCVIHYNMMIMIAIFVCYIVIRIIYAKKSIYKKRKSI